MLAGVIFSLAVIIEPLWALALISVKGGGYQMISEILYHTEFLSEEADENVAK